MNSRNERVATLRRLLTERMPHVRSVSVGVWLARGSRHESLEQSGIAHFVEHMLFKGTNTRSAEDIAQTIDSIGGQMDAFTAKEYASYYFKVLDEHLPLAVEVLALTEGAGVLWADGRRTVDLPPGARIEVRRGERPVRFVRLHEGPFTDRLVAKFGLPVQGWRGA